MTKPTLAITLGDPGGVGPEIVLKALARHPFKRPIRYVIYGSGQAFEACRKHIRGTVSIPFSDVSLEASKLLRKKGIKPGPSRKLFQPGKVSAANGALAVAALDAAIKDVKKGTVQGIVTAPIHKTACRMIHKRFHGHTEYFARAFHVKDYAMMFVGPRLKVTLATIHVPLRRVSALIRPKLIESKIKLTHDFLKQYLGIARPKIAVCALNPHGKETGTEEDRWILPAVRKMQKRSMHVTGPLSADQLFYEAYQGKYDGLISMYHDQGLGPFKMVSFHDGVNTTLGLPFIRTSPDHGTAYDIAYRNQASAQSMKQAIVLAEKLLKHRYKLS